MKKMFFIIIALSLTLFGCEKPETPKDVLSLPLTLNVLVEGGEAFKAEVKENECDIVFSGEQISGGVTLHLSDEESFATSGNFKRQVNRGLFPAQEALFKALKGLNGVEIAGLQTDSGIRYTIDEMTIIVYYDKDSDRITSIETEEKGRSFKFKVVSIEPYETQSDSAD